MVKRAATCQGRKRSREALVSTRALTQVQVGLKQFQLHQDGGVRPGEQEIHPGVKRHAPRRAKHPATVDRHPGLGIDRLTGGAIAAVHPEVAVLGAFPDDMTEAALDEHRRVLAVRDHGRLEGLNKHALRRHLRACHVGGVLRPAHRQTRWPPPPTDGLTTRGVPPNRSRSRAG